MLRRRADKFLYVLHNYRGLCQALGKCTPYPDLSIIKNFLYFEFVIKLFLCLEFVINKLLYLEFFVKNFLYLEFAIKNFLFLEFVIIFFLYLEFVINRNTPHSNFDNVVLLHWTQFCANVVVLFPSPAASRVGLLKVDFSYNSLFLCLGRNTKYQKQMIKMIQNDTKYQNIKNK